MKNIIFIFVLLFLSYGVLVGVSVAQRWTLYTTEDGLVGNSICSIREDEKGYLWFTTTTFDGASRYDGVRFQNFQKLNTTNSLPANNIYFILADKVGNVWFATDRGVSRYDGNEFKTFGEKDGLAGNIVNSILEDGKGNFWFATGRSVSRYDGKDFKTFDATNGLACKNVTFIFEDGEGNLWFGTNFGANRYNGIKFQNFDYDDGLADNNVTFILEDQEDNLWFGTERGVYRRSVKSLAREKRLGKANISSILEDQKGNLWFATESQGVIKRDRQGRFVLQNDLVDNSILSMLEDSRGNLWFGTAEGISKLEVGKEPKNFTEIKNGIPLNFVQVIWEDSDENLWFGTENGAYKYTVERLQHFTKKDGLADNSTAVVLKDKEGNLWFGTRNGVSKYDGKGFKHFTVENGLVDNSILSMLQQDGEGDLWFGTLSGVSKYDGKNFKPIDNAHPLMNKDIMDILEDGEGNLWFAIPEGVIKYDKKTVPKSFPIEDDLEMFTAKMFMDSSGNLWVGSDAGVYKLQDGGKSLEYENELPNNPVTCILEHGGNIWFGLDGGGVWRDDQPVATLLSDCIKVALKDSEGNLWLGTDKGVMKCDSSPINGSPRFQAITEADGLISNNVRSFFFDSEENLWFGTDEGVSKYDGENFQNIPLKDYLTLGYINTILEDSEGDMWFITKNNGVIKYTPPAEKNRPRIHITQIEADKIYYNSDEIRVPSTTKHITIEYKGISFKAKPHKMRYTCQLEGNGENSYSSTNETRVRYEPLKPGRYQFKVRAIDEDLHKSEPPATVNIDIFRPFYLTPQFVIPIIFCGICLLGSGGYLIVQLNKHRRIAAQLREKLVKQEEVERIQEAMMRALHQLVAGVAHEFNNLIGPLSSNSDVSSRVISRIKEMVTEESLIRPLTVLEKMNQASKIASKEIANRVAHLRSFARLDEMEWKPADIHEGIDTVIALMKSEFSGRIKVTTDYGDIPSIYCSPRSLNQVFMSKLRNACEAIEGEGEIKIKTYAQQGHVKIEISDTGRGIPEEDINRIFEPGFTKKDVGVGVGLGLSICKKIVVEEHKGRIDVSSELGEGTTFTITLPQYRDEGKGHNNIAGEDIESQGHGTGLA